MTLLQKAYQTLNQDKKEKKLFLLELKRPERDIEFIPFNIPQVRSVKCTKEKLSKVLAFIEMKKFSRFSTLIITIFKSFFLHLLLRSKYRYKDCLLNNTLSWKTFHFGINSI